MVDKIGKKGFNTSGRGSIGRMSFGKPELSERQRQTTVNRNAKEWRDEARRNILRYRENLKSILRKNEAKIEKRLKARKKNLNPLFFSLLPKFSRRRRNITITHSTVPKKPKYSTVEPSERIYGMKWLKLSEQKQKTKMHPAIKAAVEEIRAGIKEKAEKLKRE